MIDFFKSQMEHISFFGGIVFFLLAVVGFVLMKNRNAKEELRKYRERLELLVKERTAELSEVNQRLHREINERRGAEEMITRLSRQNELILQCAGEGIYGVDLNGDTTFLNPAAAKMLGWNLEEIIGKSPHDLMHHSRPDGTPYPKDECLVYAAFKDGEIHHVTDEVFWRKDGTSFPVEYVSTPIMENGGAVGAVVIFRNITERKRAEAALRESEGRFRSLFNFATDGIFLLDPSDKEIPTIVDVNIAACVMNKYTRRELIGKPVTFIDDNEGTKKVPDILDRLKAGEEVTFEIDHARKDGSVFPVEVSARLLYIEGRPYILSIDRDITERKQVEDELRKHRERLLEMVEEKTVELKTAVQLLTQEIAVRKKTEKTLKESESKFRRLSQEFHTLLDAIPDTLILLSPDLRVMWANKGASLEFARDISEITGKCCYELWHSRSTHCDDCHARKSFLTGKAEITQRSTPDGRLLDSKSFPIKDEDGRTNNVILIVSDVTEKTTLEAEAMRASHLASLGELAAGVAHEINNPINGIINYAQLIANKSTEGSKENDIANRIIKEGDRISGIVRNLLSFARERREEKLAVGLQRIIVDTITLTEAQVRKDGIHIKMDIPSDLPQILANPQQIQQVFLNIISNSRYALNKKYSGAHENKRLEISAKKTPIEGLPHVRITFYDRGCGIPADILDKVMNPFFSTKPSGQGTGLGLSISHGLVKDHGGRLMLESKEGRFTKVMVDLPTKEKDGR